MHLPPNARGFGTSSDVVFVAREHYEEALTCYDHALAVRGDIPQIWNYRGNALQNLDRLEEAEESLRGALRLKPDFANAHQQSRACARLLRAF